MIFSPLTHEDRPPGKMSWQGKIKKRFAFHLRLDVSEKFRGLHLSLSTISGSNVEAPFSDFLRSQHQDIGNPFPFRPPYFTSHAHVSVVIVNPIGDPGQNFLARLIKFLRHRDDAQLDRGQPERKLSLLPLSHSHGLGLEYGIKHPVYGARDRRM